MKSPVCDMLGMEFPLFAFSHCRDVVVAVSRAGGFGVLGATSHSPETVEQELKWIDDHIDGKPYGIDVLIPENISTAGEKDVTWKSLQPRITPRIATLQKPPQQIRHRIADHQHRRQPAAAVRHAARHGGAGGLVQPPDPADCQCARRAAEGNDRDGPEARRAGRSAGRRQGARRASSRGRCRHSGCTRHRSRWPLRRGVHHGDRARGDQGREGHPRRAGACGRRHHRPDGRWPPQWRWARPAHGPARCGWRR